MSTRHIMKLNDIIYYGSKAPDTFGTGVGNYTYRLYVCNFLAEKYNLGNIEEFVLLFCYADAFKKYGKIITIDDPEIAAKIRKGHYGELLDYRKYSFEHGSNVKEDDLDVEFIEKLKLFVKEYQVKKYDIPYFKNIVDIDLNQINKLYPELDNSFIFPIIMYRKCEEYQDSLLNLLTKFNVSNQRKIINLISPISNDVLINNKKIDEDTINNKRIIFPYVEFKSLLKNGTCDKEQLDNMYSEKYYKTKISFKEIKTNNYYFIREFEYFFQDVLLAYQDRLSPKALSILLKIKMYTLTHIPEATGKNCSLPIYKEIEYSYPPADIYGHVDYTKRRREIEKIKVGEEVVSSINYSEKLVLSYKKAILLLFPMLIENNIDYYKLMDCDCSDFIKGIIEYVKPSQKVKKR